MSKTSDRTYATILGIALAVIVVFSVLAIARFVFGGPEDDWICSQGQWVRHGNPVASMPVTPCLR
jgi:hypothetical protein